MQFRFDDGDNDDDDDVVVVVVLIFVAIVRQALDLNLKCVSKKVKAVKLGITLECTFMKEGKAM